MNTAFPHLELVFLASTVTPAWGVGWAFTNTTVPQPRVVVPETLPVRFRLALRAS